MGHNVKPLYSEHEVVKDRVSRPFGGAGELLGSHGLHGNRS